MADVQTEYGFSKIANAILENMARIKLSPTQYRILFVVWRSTYGFNRKEHELALSYLANATGCDKRQLQRELKGLNERRIIHQNIVNGISRTISFNKNHDEWINIFKNSLTQKHCNDPNVVERNDTAYRKWRASVLSRDKKTCQECGSKKDLTVHHIKSYAKYVDLRCVVSNGITCCETCHKKIHKEVR